MRPGIGLAVAQRLAASGARSPLGPRCPVASMPRAAHGFAHVDTVDVADAADVDRAAQSTARALGGVDVLVCSAGGRWRERPDLGISARGMAARVRRERARRVPLQSRPGADHATHRLRPHRQHRLDRTARKAIRPRRPTAPRRRGDRPHQEPGQGAREDGDSRELRHRRGSHGDLRPDHAAAHRLHAVQDFDGSAFTVEEIAALVCWLASEECSFSTGGVFDASGGRATY